MTAEERILHATKGAFIDTFLSDFSTKITNTAFVGDIIAPRLKVKKSSGKFPTYGREHLRLYNNQYKSGQRARQVTFTTGQGTYSTEEFALEDNVTEKDVQNADDPLDPEMDTVEFLTEAMQLARENRVISIVTDTALITNASAGGLWDDASGTPKRNIFTGIKTIKDAVLRPPTHIFIPFEVALNLALHADYTGDHKSGTLLLNEFGLPAKLWGLIVVVVTVGYSSGDQIGASDPALTSLWGESVLLAYINPTQTLKSITAMRTFMTSNRVVIRSGFDPMKHAEDFQLHEELDEKLVSADAMYLITNTLTG